jgi:hypothetical protein
MQIARIANDGSEDTQATAAQVGGLDERSEEWESSVRSSNETTTDAGECVAYRNRTEGKPVSVSSETIVAFADRLNVLQQRRCASVMERIWKQKEPITPVVRRHFLRMWWRWKTAVENRER